MDRVEFWKENIKMTNGGLIQLTPVESYPSLPTKNDIKILKKKIIVVVIQWTRNNLHDELID